MLDYTGCWITDAGSSAIYDVFITMYPSFTFTTALTLQSIQTNATAVINFNIDLTIN